MTSSVVSVVRLGTAIAAGLPEAAAVKPPASAVEIDAERHPHAPRPFRSCHFPLCEELPQPGFDWFKHGRQCELDAARRVEQHMQRDGRDQPLRAIREPAQQQT